MRKVRVFQLIKGLGRGGAEVLLLQGLRAANRDRFTYGYGYLVHPKDDLVEDLRQEGGEVHCFGVSAGNLAIPFEAVRIARFLRDWGADLLHCHLPIAGAIGRIAGQIAKVPVVYTEHNRIENYHPISRWMNWATWRMQRRVFAVSTDVAESLHENRMSSSVKVDVVLNGVDVDAFDPDGVNPAPFRERFGIPPHAPTVGTVAVFRPQKCLHDWLAVAQTVQERRPGTHFILVGDGPLRSALLAAAKDRGLEGAVHFCGLMGDVRPALASMNVYLMSSEFEGLPIALLEAMAMRRAIVSTAVGGVAEAIVKEHSGRLSAPGDTNRLADCVVELLEEPKRAEWLGKNARERVRECFSIRTMTRTLEEAYVEVLDGYGSKQYQHSESQPLRPLADP